jgi:EAL domain-containing protein (putative c-di-GMP-specific phosphodiesterase class I)
LDETGLSPSLLQLEIKESALMDARISKNILDQARAMGIRLSLDDFGTELAAFSCLNRFPLDVVKAGQSLVRELPGQDWEASMAEAILRVAQKMKISVCAEGVETMAQLTFLEDHGCHAAQGFFLSPPLAFEEMNHLIEDELRRRRGAGTAMTGTVS